MSAAWTAADVAAACRGRVRGDWVAVGVSIDSRTVEAGDLFVAIAGPVHDGHAYIATAMDRGAVAALVSTDWAHDHDEPNLAMVPDTAAALSRLGAAGRTRCRARIAGVTGSVGKTSVKEALRHVLSRQGCTHASAKSYNNQWGVPLSLARMPANADFGIFEIGMNQSGEIRPLSRLVRPDVAVVTAIAPAHLGLLGSMEAIADAKAEIFEGLDTGGLAVLDRDGPFFDRLAKAARAVSAGIVTYGRYPNADVRLVEAAGDARGSDLTVRLRGRDHRFRLGVSGKHWQTNATAVLATVHALGADPLQAMPAMRDLEAVTGRGARCTIQLPNGGRVLLLDESYNANPASVRAALDVLGSQPGRHVAVLGDMLELGPAADAFHAELAEPVALAGVERLFTCGPMMRHLHEAVPAAIDASHAVDSAAVIGPLLAELRSGDVVLVKGSLGSRMGRVVEALKAVAHASSAVAG